MLATHSKPSSFINSAMSSQTSKPTRRSALLRHAATALLLIGCIAALISTSNNNNFIHSLPSAVKHFSSTSWSEIPGRRDVHSMMRGLNFTYTKEAVVSVRAFTVESAELAWEKAELAWDTLKQQGRGAKISKDEENPFFRAVGGLMDILKIGEKGGNTHTKRSNVRRRKQMKHKKEKRDNSVRRRLKAVDSKDEQFYDGASKDQLDNGGSLLSSLGNFPLPARVLVFVGVVISLVASFIASSDSRKLNRLARSYERRNIIVDEEEAEILEFYEKEMESGSLSRRLSFDVLVDVNERLDLEDRPQSEGEPLGGDSYGQSSHLHDIQATDNSTSDVRQPNRFATLYEGGNIAVSQEEAEILEFYEKEKETGSFDRNLSFETFNDIDLEDGSDQTGSSSKGSLYIMRDSGGAFRRDDNFLDCEGIDGIDQNEPVQKRMSEAGIAGEEATVFDFNEEEKETGSYDRNLSLEAVHVDDDNGEPKRVTQQHDSTRLTNKGSQGVSCLSSDLHEVHLIPNADVPRESFTSIHDQSKVDFYDCESCQQQSQGEDSLTSSISSLTSENYSDDIEASLSFGTIGSEDSKSPSTTTLSVTESQQYSPTAVDQTNSPLFSEADHDISTMAETPLIQNIYCHRDARDKISKPQFERRVSFNPHVTVKEIPRRQVEDHLTSESYLYIMLFAVGIVIALLSLFSTHPSLSPIASMTKKEIINRADSLLSSQWEVEL